ncbi:hypothetical protein ACFOUP_12300 [Belliella kenyensis]|uniref:YD repeat-containing protein n=1 Tax=Belliella kenyensis TaxID=1472724 RepID=A0ABV8EMM5_9BACT|nr:hypothetical protein [Belliella kenyensis]MCH7400745.1 hypothetical protein [Belliella kenyensis]MDN3601968.1 hypothetical protein [Belliella kenyensis]
MLFLIFVVTNKAFSQTSSLPKINATPPPPEAGALLKNVNIPVSLTTGVPNISIPIHTIDLNGFSLPISINYNSSGIKTSETASNVGLGWSLSAGGMISSMVLGISDLEGNGYLYTGVNIPDTRVLDPRLTHVDTNTYSENADYTLAQQIIGNQVVSYTFGVPNPMPASTPIDSQPDIFYYSFGDKQGKFFFAKNGQIKTIPFTPISITKAQHFIILDELGNKFTFGTVETSVTTSTEFSSSPDFGGGSSQSINFIYYLTKIETPSGQFIDLSYDNVQYSLENPKSYTRFRRISSISNGLPTNVETRVESSTLINGKILRSIISNVGDTVLFNYESCPRIDMKKASNQTGSKALKEIQIRSSGLVSKFQLQQSYFNLSNYQPCQTQENSSLYRLKLNSIQREGEEPYIFEYYGNNSLPNRLSEIESDHWGYYINTGGKYFHEPQFGFTDGGNREPSLSLTRYGTIQKVIYPTKGHAEFEYELNMARDTLVTVSNGLQYKSASIYYSPNVSYQSIPFTIGQNANLASIRVDFHTTTSPPVANLRFDAFITGNGVNMNFQSVNGYGSQFVALSKATYNLNVEQVGQFEEGFIRISWNENTPGGNNQVIDNYNLGGLRIKSIKYYDFGNTTPVKRQDYKYTLFDNSNISSGMISNKPKYTRMHTKYVRRYHSELGMEDIQVNYWVQNSTSIDNLSGMQGHHVMYKEVHEYSDANGQIGMTQSKFSFVKDLMAYVSYPATIPTSYDWQRGLLLETTHFKYNSGTNQFIRVNKIENFYTFMYTPPSSISTGEIFAHYTPAAAPNETHALGVNIQLLAPEFRVYQNALSFRVAAMYEITSYKLISAWYFKNKSISYSYNEAGVEANRIETNYFFDKPIHAQLTRKNIINSSEHNLFEFFSYPLDYNNTTGFLKKMKDSHQKSYPVEHVKFIQKNSIYEILSGEIVQYKDNLKAQPDKRFSLVSNVPISHTAFKFSDRNIGVLPTQTSSGIFGMDSRYVEEDSFTQFDVLGNLTEHGVTNGIFSAQIWGYNLKYPIAVCKNALISQIAFSSFETNEKGGWTYSGAPVTNINSKTGLKYYNLNSGTISKSGIGASTSTPYKLTFWARRASGSGTWDFLGTSENLTTEWKLIQRTITSSSITITGTGIHIDELRLHPANAMMTTYTYKPLVGVSSVSDPRNNITYYEYDNANRLLNVRNDSKEIIETYEYKYKGTN